MSIPRTPPSGFFATHDVPTASPHAHPPPSLLTEHLYECAAAAELEKGHSGSLPDLHAGRKNDTERSYAAFVTTRNKRRREDDISTELTANKEEMMSYIASRFDGQTNAISSLVNVVKEIQSSNTNIISSIEFLREQNEDLKRKIDSLETQRMNDREHILLLENKVEELQLTIRKPNFELKNVPKQEKESKEDLVEMVVSLSNTVGCDITKKDIKDIYRVRGRKDSSPNTPIIVETTSTLIKTDLMKMCKTYNIRHKSKLCAKQLGLRKNEDTPVFISENLTSRAARLHFLARDLVKTRKFKFCWTAYGKVYIRKDENSPVITITSEAQCVKLMNSD